MVSQHQLHFRSGDLFAAALVILLTVFTSFVFLPNGTADPQQAEIYQNGQLLKTVFLDKPQEFTITGNYYNTITVRDGSIAITASDCPGADCVHSGAIQTSGRSIVCLPNGVEIRITADSADVDFIVR
ncbi:MAG: NusG domain II-containing protein [Oscillospiraceae bacterium]|nr:NusG domain II-containing protein [Oscillospiraceae bacterium]